MAQGNIIRAAGSYPLGGIGEGIAGSIALCVEALTGSIAVQCRPTGSGQTYVTIAGVNKNAPGTYITSIVANGLYVFDISGFDCQLVVTTGPATIGYNFISGGNG